MVTSNRKTVDNNLAEPKKIFAQEVQRRRNLCLCFKCGEKYGMGYQCTLNNLSFMILEEKEELEPVDSKEIPGEGEDDNGAILDVCLNALTNQLKKNMITLFEVLQNTLVRILIDMGSTHNYMHCQLAKTLVSTIRD